MPRSRATIAERTLQAQITRIDNDIALVEAMIERHQHACDTLRNQRLAMNAELQRIRTANAKP